MTKIKSIPKEDVEKLIKLVQEIQRLHKDCYVESPLMAYGYASAVFPALILKLKGELPI